MPWPRLDPRTPNKSKNANRSRTPGSKAESGSIAKNAGQTISRRQHSRLQESLYSTTRFAADVLPLDPEFPFDRPSAASQPNTSSFNLLFPIPSSMISSCPFINHSNTLTPQGPRSSSLTSKFHISIPFKPSQGLHSRPSTRTVPVNTDPGPRSPRIPLSPTLPNGFISKEHREAALRERGLRPPRKDLSQQEREADERRGSVPSPSSCIDVHGLSEAERLKETWLAKNHSSDSANSVLAPSATPHLEDTATRPPSTPPSTLSEIDVRHQSGEGRLPSLGRPSFYSSVPPLSASSGLEVLHEDLSEQAPITPALVSPANVRIVVSSPIDCSPSLIFAESPISCTFSSLSGCPGSTAESQSQSDQSRLPENGENRRGRKSISGGSPCRMGSSPSRVGSLSNTRRSVVSSLGLPSTHSSADPPPSPTLQAPRTAISPTIHNIGSIIREARDIADAESRRLSELAFLDCCASLEGKSGSSYATVAFQK